MHWAAVLLLVAAATAGCSDSDGTPEAGGPPGGTGDTTTTSESPRTPPGWARDDCDKREPRFSTAVAPLATFRRDNVTAHGFASRVVEAVDDRVKDPDTPSGTPGRNEAQSWHTEDGTVEVFWETDAAAWSAEYVATLPADSGVSLEQAAYAIVGSLQIPADGLSWSEEGPRMRAAQDVNGTLAVVLEVTDQEVLAEQSTLVRRQVVVHPAYEEARLRLAAAEARAIAQSVVDCKNEGPQPDVRLAEGEPSIRVVSGHAAYWYGVEPVGDWEPCPDRTAALHVAIDAETGVVLSIDVACGSTA